MNKFFPSEIKLILFILSLFYIVNPVLAGDVPILISPANNSTISSSPTFSWQAVPGSVEYNILIDDEPTVTSPYAKTPYYPTNPSYSPQTLNPGTYYWKVKAKDSSGNWGGFSNIWSFTLANSTPTPTPTPTSTPSPSSSSSSSTSSFTISNTPSQINSDQSFNISVSLSLPNNPNTTFYLKGAFKKTDGTNYFGLTKVSGSWVKNGSSYSNQYPITTDSSGNWSGTLEVKPDADDSGYTGTDDYILKVGRYTNSGSGPTWSNEFNIKIVAVTQSFLGGTTSTSTKSVSSNKPLSSSSITPSSKSLVSSSNFSPKIDYKIASVAAAIASATPSASVEVKSEKRTNFLAWIGAALIIAGLGSLIFIYLRNRKTV